MSINIVALHLNGKYHYHSKIIMGKFKSYLNVGIIAAVLKDGKINWIFHRFHLYDITVYLRTNGFLI